MGRITLLTGGVRSGKSSLAERLASERELATYIATAEAGDGEMAERIDRHRGGRPNHWRTIESPFDLPGAVRSAVFKEDEAVIIDCLTLYVSNLLGRGREAAGIVREADELVDACRKGGGRFIVVTNEVGGGIVPDDELARVYEDILGRVNQAVAAAADEVYLLVAGIPVKVKG
ncbi:MAG: bifunctional adenosylcobinamide kinase/adenosylcobinamide-phosphate guanylyltransferase [Candidatus Aquicultorales bacterium]